MRAEELHVFDNKTIAIISYYSFGGENVLAFAGKDLKLFSVDQSRMRTLAKSIGADYLIVLPFAAIRKLEKNEVDRASVYETLRKTDSRNGQKKNCTSTKPDA